MNNFCTFQAVSPKVVNRFSKILILHEAMTLLFKTQLVPLQCFLPKHTAAQDHIQSNRFGTNLTRKVTTCMGPRSQWSLLKPRGNRFLLKIKNVVKNFPHENLYHSPISWYFTTQPPLGLSGLGRAPESNR